MLIDTHAHLNFRDFKDDWSKIIERSLARNVWLINVGSNYETSKKAIEISQKYEQGIFAAVGFHPIHANEENFDKEKFRSLAHLNKAVAIGEIGLDYYREYGLFKEKQKEVFLEQMDLAKELNLPVILHCRKAHQNLIEILKSKIKNQKSKISGVVHCFTGGWREAEQYLKMGFYLGFNGIIYKLNLKEVIKKTPLDRILIETDCPYLTPLPAVALAKAGPKDVRNEPIFVEYIAKDIARIKNIDLEQVSQATTKNAKNLFNI